MRYVLGSRAGIGGVLGSGRGGGGNGLLTGLVAYWALDEAGGANNAFDKHSVGLTLTQYNSPGAATGKVYVTARNFNKNQYFFRSSESALQAGNSSFAVASWVYWTGGNNQGVLGKYQGSIGEYWIAFYSPSAPYLVKFQFRNAQNTQTITVDSLGAIPVNTWTLIIASYDHGNGIASLQINNDTPIVENCGSVGINNSTNEFRLATYYAINETMSGRIGPVMMWKNRTLDATARAALWNGGAGLAYSEFTA